MKRLRRKYSNYQLPNSRGVLGDLVVKIDGVGTDDIHIFGNTVLPDEIYDAALFWAKMDGFAQLSLTEYLNYMFDATNYTLAIL